MRTTPLQSYCTDCCHLDKNITNSKLDFIGQCRLHEVPIYSNRHKRGCNWYDDKNACITDKGSANEYGTLKSDIVHLWKGGRNEHIGYRVAKYADRYFVSPDIDFYEWRFVEATRVFNCKTYETINEGVIDVLIAGLDMAKRYNASKKQIHLLKQIIFEQRQLSLF